MYGIIQCYNTISATRNGNAFGTRSKISYPLHGKRSINLSIACRAYGIVEIGNFIMFLPRRGYGNSQVRSSGRFYETQKHRTEDEFIVK